MILRNRPRIRSGSGTFRTKSCAKTRRPGVGSLPHEASPPGALSMTSPAFALDAYGTLFDVHAAISRHRAAAGPDAARLSELWRNKQLEYACTLTLAGRHENFKTLTGRP